MGKDDYWMVGVGVATSLPLLLGLIFLFYRFGAATVADFFGLG